MTLRPILALAAIALLGGACGDDGPAACQRVTFLFGTPERVTGEAVAAVPSGDSGWYIASEAGGIWFTTTLNDSQSLGAVLPLNRRAEAQSFVPGLNRQDDRKFDGAAVSSEEAQAAYLCAVEGR